MHPGLLNGETKRSVGGGEETRSMEFLGFRVNAGNGAGIMSVFGVVVEVERRRLSSFSEEV